MKIGEDTAIKIDLKTIVAIIMITSTFVGMYYTLQADIEVEKNEPAAQIERLEFDLKEEWNEKSILNLQERIEMLEEGQDLFCLLYTSPSPRDRQKSRMPSSA